MRFGKPVNFPPGNSALMSSYIETGASVLGIVVALSGRVSAIEVDGVVMVKSLNRYRACDEITCCRQSGQAGRAFGLTMYELQQSRRSLGICSSSRLFAVRHETNEGRNLFCLT